MAKKKGLRKKGYPSPAAVQLISHLSEGAYTTFAKAVKELVNNAFDADAMVVNLNFSEDFSQLIISDDGDGVSDEKFKSEFLRIAGSKRRLEKRKRRFARPLIGKFGIGFLSVARLCEKATVYSKQKGRFISIVREIPLKHFFDADKQLKDLQKEHYYYSLPDTKETSKDKSYTKIVLDELHEDIKESLKSREKSKKPWSTLDELSGIDRFKWELGMLLPVRYRRQFPVAKRSNSIIARVKKELGEFNFKVFLDGEEILKPICFGRHYFKNSKWEYVNGKYIPADEYDVFEIESPAQAKIKFHGYIYNQSKQIQPGALRGILLRVNHVGIKGFSKSLYEYPRNIGPILSAISGEVFLGSDFEDVLTLDKDDFKEDHPFFKELVGYIHNRIDDVAAFSRSRSARARKKRRPLPKVKDLNLSSDGIQSAEKIIGRKKLRKEYFPNLNLSIKTNVKNLRTTVENLIGQTLDPDEGDYLLESLDCFDGDCFRGSILMAWNTGMFRIHRKIDQNVGYNDLANAIKKIRQNAPTYLPNIPGWFPTSIEELKRYNERVLCVTLAELKLLDKTTADLFAKVLGELRNRSAHPTGHKPTNGEAIFVVQAILKNILNNNLFKVN